MMGMACPRSCRPPKAEGTPAGLPVLHWMCWLLLLKAALCHAISAWSSRVCRKQLSGESCFLLTGKCCLWLFQECLKKKEELKSVRIRKARIVNRCERGKRSLRETQIKLNACIELVNRVMAEEAKIVADEKRLEEVVRRLGGDPTPPRCRQ